jgi:predicted AAA+ superfamily ATPase
MIKMTEIAEQNPWWRHATNFFRYDPHLSKTQAITINRKILFLEKENIYIIEGPRLAGKSTYLKTLIRDLLVNNIPPQQIYYLSCISFTSRRELKNALQYFVDSNKDKPVFYVLLDEASAVKGWDIEVKAVFDKGVMQNGILVIALSNASHGIKLAQTFSGSGQKIIYYHLKPICFREFVLQTSGHISKLLPGTQFGTTLPALLTRLSDGALDLSRGIDHLDQEVSKLLEFRKELDILLGYYQACGGFPTVINNYLTNLSRQSSLGRQSAAAIDPLCAEMFIRGLLGDLSKAQKQETIMRHMMKSMIERYGRRYSFSNLAREIEITHVTVIDYLKYFEDSYFGLIVYAYDLQKREPKLKGDKKIYFSDPFLGAVIKSYLSSDPVWSVIAAALDDPAQRARLTEALVNSHLLAAADMPGSRTARDFLWFYYDKTGKEMGSVTSAGAAFWELDIKGLAEPAVKSPKKISRVPLCIRLTQDEHGRTRNRIWIPTSVFLALISASAGNL